MEVREIVLIFKQKQQKACKHLSAAERIFKQRYGRPVEETDMEEIYNLSELLRDIYGKEETDNNKR